MLLTSAVAVVVAATVLFTLFVRAKDVPPPEPVSPTRHLEERKAAIYENLRDLQFEYRLGKLSDQDYQSTKVGLQKELAGVIAEIEQTPQQGAAKPAKPAVPKQAAAKAAAPSTAKANANAFECPHCGASFPNPMKFCGECGKAMG
jgi:UDP-N-acetylenolpyruvoylglucosamine reductase